MAINPLLKTIIKPRFASLDIIRTPIRRSEFIIIPIISAKSNLTGDISMIVQLDNNNEIKNEKANFDTEQWVK